MQGSLNDLPEPTPDAANRALAANGFTILPGPVAQLELPILAAAYDNATTTADPGDLRRGTSTTRLSNLLNYGPAFDSLLTFPPLLSVARDVLARPLRLSTLLARTLHPRTPAQDLHVDFAADQHGWTMLGFIFMVDAFTPDNGATRFLPGSHLAPPQLPSNLKAPIPGEMLACAPAGSLILFNGAISHGHTVNRTGLPRRSIQGAFIRRDAPSGNYRLLPETLARLPPLARHLLAADEVKFTP